MEVSLIEQLITTFQKEIGPEKSKWVMDQFTSDKSIEDMFTFLWDLDEAQHFLTPTLVPSEKSSSKADKLRIDGENFHTQGNMDKALELYNQSIIEAPHPPVSQAEMNNNQTDPRADYKTLAMGYASRSAIFFELEQYDQCISDINLALGLGCSELDSKLEERKSHCIRIKEERKHNLNEELCKEVDYGDMNSMFQICMKVADQNVSSKDILKKSSENRELPKVEDPHQNIPALSNAIKVNYDPNKGRHIIASRDIYPGEVVGMEKSYCDGIYWEDLHTHCSTCLKECLAPLPCPNCSMVIFCSEECQRVGLSSGSKGLHKLECDILPTVATLEKKENIVSYIALRLILQTSYQKLKEDLPLLRKESEEINQVKLGFDSNGSYSSTEYRPIYHLVGNKNQRPPEEMFETCVTAFIFTKLLTKNEYFFRNNEGQPLVPSRNDLLMTGQILMYHMLNIFCNAFQLSDMTVTAAPVTTILRVFGEGVFPALSLFNHSCNPTVRHLNNGNHMALRAVRFIAAGEEVTTTYCGSFYKEPLEDRQEHLSNSYIKCTCEACLGEWPVTKQLPFEMLIKCTNCYQIIENQDEEEPTCSACSLNFNRDDYGPEQMDMVNKWWFNKQTLQDTQRKCQLILLRKKAGQPVSEEDFRLLSYFIELSEKYVQLPCQSYCCAVDTLFLLICLQLCTIIKHSS